MEQHPEKGATNQKHDAYKDREHMFRMFMNVVGKSTSTSVCTYHKQ